MPLRSLFAVAMADAPASSAGRRVRHAAVFSAVKHRRRKRSVSRGAIALVVSLSLSPSPAGAIDAPEQGTSLSPEDAGSSREAVQDQISGLVEELRTLAESYGPDVVLLQAALLLETIRAGAIAASEVSVEGVSALPAGDHLRIRVLTGQIFDRAASTPRSRLEHMWNRVAAPALDRMERFDFRPASLELVLGFGLQDFAATIDGRADPTLQYPMREVHLRLDAADLALVASRSMDSGDLFDHAKLDPEEPWSTELPPRTGSR